MEGVDGMLLQVKMSCEHIVVSNSSCQLQIAVRDSSAGVQLLHISTLDAASGFTVTHVFGFVEELIAADDVEYKWSENFRRARVSHESRQTLLYLLDASVRRRMCKTVLERGML